MSTEDEKPNLGTAHREQKLKPLSLSHSLSIFFSQLLCGHVIPGIQPAPTHFTHKSTATFPRLFGDLGKEHRKELGGMSFYTNRQGKGLEVYEMGYAMLRALNFRSPTVYSSSSHILQLFLSKLRRWFRKCKGGVVNSSEKYFSPLGAADAHPQRK